jgi:hypothetical protein
MAIRRGRTRGVSRGSRVPYFPAISSTTINTFTSVRCSSIAIFEGHSSFLDYPDNPSTIWQKCDYCSTWGKVVDPRCESCGAPLNKEDYA